MQDKTALRVIILLFIVTLGLLYYNNSFNEVTVYIAERNIAKDSIITKDHVSAIAMHKGNILPGAITDKEVIIDQIASVNIQKGDIFTKNKMSDTKIQSSQKYLLRIPINNMDSPRINIGDIIRVYLITSDRRESSSERYIVIDTKIVSDISYTLDRNGNPRPDGYTMKVSDIELESYMLASQLGEITTIKVNDTSLPDLTESTPHFRVR